MIYDPGVGNYPPRVLQLLDVVPRGNFRRALVVVIHIHVHLTYTYYSYLHINVHSSMLRLCGAISYTYLEILLVTDTKK